MDNMKRHIALAQYLVAFLDNKFDLFGIRFGIDPFLTIIPGLGNTIGVFLSCYLFWIAKELGVPRHIFITMARNIGVDFLLGWIPFAGFVFDFFYKANVKNIALLQPYIDEWSQKGVVLED